MKPLLKFTEEQIEQMSGMQLHAIYCDSTTFRGFHHDLAKRITDSNECFEWVEQVFEDPDELELQRLLQYTLERHVFIYIQKHFADKIDDKIRDYLEGQWEKDAPYTYRGLNKKEFLEVS